MIFIIYKVSGGRALFSAVSDPGGAGIQAGAPHRHQEQSRTILKRFISAARTPGGMIDRTRSGKRN